MREATYRQLMRLHARSGQRALALRTYHACAGVLQRELGVAPAADTRRAYEVLVAAPGRAGPVGTDAPRLVGRDVEWQRCAAAWKAAAAGSAGMLVVSGEPGIGKTRLVEELDRRLSGRDVATAWARMYAVEGGLAYAAVVDWLRSKVVRPAVRALDEVWRAEVARLLPELLVETPGLRRPERLSGPQLRLRLFEALERAMLARGGPLLFVLDDLQWCDQDSVEFLHHLLLARADARMLVVATLRSEEIGPAHPVSALLTDLSRADRLVEVRLGPLGRADVAGIGEPVARRPGRGCAVGTAVARHRRQPAVPGGDGPRRRGRA